MRAAGRRGTTVAALGAASCLLLSGLTLGAAAQAAGSASLRPASGTAVKGGQLVEVSGTVPAGAVESAVLEGLDPQGVVKVTQDVTSKVGAPRATGEYLAVEGTALSGRLGLDLSFSGPPAGRPVVRRVRLVLRQVGVQQPTVSSLARVDHDKPYLRSLAKAGEPQRGGYEVITPTQVLVRFNEPLAHPLGDAASDWVVSEPDRRVTEVRPATEGDCVGRYLPGEDDEAGRTGCTRTLVLDSPLGEDDEPFVAYAPSALATERTSARYEDGARNQISGVGARQRSRDRTRAARPSITAVGGRPVEGGSASGSSTAPTVRVGNLVAGQQLQVTAAPAVGEAVSTTLTTDAATEEVTLPALPQQPEGTPYRITAVVTDTHGNSSRSALQPGRADGAPDEVAYAVDSTVPQLVGAVPGASRDVTVTFSEAVSGGDNPADWTIVDDQGRRVVVLAVSGSGSSRTLTTLQSVPNSAAITYAPVGTRYSDRAGNALADGTVRVDGVDLPVLTDPVAPVLTRATTYVVRGTAEAGSVVRLFRDAEDDGTPDGEALDTDELAPGATAFALDAVLTRNAATDLVVVVTDRATGATRSAPVGRITSDDTPPSLVLTSPAGGEVFAGGSRQEARSRYEDANPGAVRVELSLDGSAFSELSPGAAPGAAFAFVLPRVSTDSARLRLTPRDAAGNVGPAVTSEPFTVDAVPPAFTARTVDARTVRVVFPERGLTGRSTGLDWRVDGAPVSSATTSTGPEGETVVLLVLAPGQSLAPDATPSVRYEPTVPGEQYRDRAGQTVVDGVDVADDGIAPSAPTIASPSAPVLTADSELPVSGTAQPGVEVQVRDDAGRAVGTTVAGSDGRWSLLAVLQRDRTNVLSASARDSSGNASPGAPVPAVEQDSTAPAVSVTAPAAGSRVEPGTRATASWTSTDRHPLDGETLVELSTDAGRTWRTVAEEQPRSGSAAFDVPEVRTGTAALRVTVPDRAGRRGSAVSSPIGIGMAAATPSPTPTRSAAPPLAGLPDGTFTPAVGRLLDTRRSGVAVGPGGTLRLQVAGVAGVPATGAEAVALTLTAVQPGAKTHVSVVPSGADPEATAALTAAKGETVANHVTVRLGPDGAVVLRNDSGSTHLVADLLGWYAADGGAAGAPFAPLPPQRLLDTREGVGAAQGRTAGTVALRVLGRGGVPAEGVSAVVLGVAAVGPSASTHVTVWPGGSARPGTSNLNVSRGQTRANLVTVPVGPDGVVQLASGGAQVHLVADVFGWYGPAAAGVLEPVQPARVLDTRTGSREPATAGRDLVLRVAGRGGLPASGVRAVVLQLTAVAPSDSTHVTAWASGAGPGTANLNAARGTTVSTQVVVPVAPDGTVRLGVGKGRVHLVADVAGWFRAR